MNGILPRDNARTSTTAVAEKHDAIASLGGRVVLADAVIRTASTGKVNRKLFEAERSAEDQ